MVAAPSTRPRREAIVDEAVRLFRAHGVHAVTTRAIAAAVGISQPSLYAHFATKQAIVEAACIRAFQGLTSAMRDALALPDAEALPAMARAYVDFALRQPDAYRVAFMIEDEPPGEAVMQAAGEAFQLYRAAVARRHPDAPPADVDMIAQSAWVSLHGLVSLLIARPDFSWCDRARLIDFHIGRTAPG
ncbi:MAG TPA: TetR/AcrR family transcriptional regulator [Caulobacteraceae bacterium]|nr:TetR/AcrR family transcriptional regulator [Caulobacteraceae bacterium]